MSKKTLWQNNSISIEKIANFLADLEIRDKSCKKCMKKVIAKEIFDSEQKFQPLTF